LALTQRVFLKRFVDKSSFELFQPNRSQFKEFSTMFENDCIQETTWQPNLSFYFMAAKFA